MIYKAEEDRELIYKDIDCNSLGNYVNGARGYNILHIIMDMERTVNIIIIFSKILKKIKMQSDIKKIF